MSVKIDLKQSFLFHWISVLLISVMFYMYLANIIFGVTSPLTNQKIFLKTFLHISQQNLT